MYGNKIWLQLIPIILSKGVLDLQALLLTSVYLWTMWGLQKFEGIFHHVYHQIDGPIKENSNGILNSQTIKYITSLSSCALTLLRKI